MTKTKMHRSERERLLKRIPGGLKLTKFEPLIKDFPTTRFRGSKRKILPWIHDKLKELEFETVLDLFGGTGAVSFLFKKMGKEVTFNDYLKCNYLMGKALIENDQVRLNWEELTCDLGDPMASKFTFIQKEFSGFYFTDNENRWIDQMVFRIESMQGPRNVLSFKKALGYYALFQSCLVKRPYNLFHRKNLYMRLATVKRSFGNKTTWDKPFVDHFKTFLDEINNKTFAGLKDCRATNMDAFRYPAEGYDLVYMDPPYIIKKRGEAGDYFRSYHFLEGLASYKWWERNILKGSVLKSLKTPKNDIFASARSNKEGFKRLFKAFSKSIVVVSYKCYGSPSLSWLKSELLKTHNKVVIHTKHYTYALNHQNGDAIRNREALIIATPK